MSPPNLLTSAVVLAAAILTTLPPTSLRAEERTMDRVVTVTATGYATAEPDQARLTTGVTAEAGTARAALSRNSEVMKKVIDGLKESGIDAKDIQTSNFHVEPRYTSPRDGAPAVIDGYRVSNQVEIMVRDLKGLGELLDKLATLGANQMQGLAFEVSKAETLKDEARKEAVANALRRAKLFAEATGAEVGEVVSISEETNYGGPRPYTMARAAKAQAVPVESGTETLEARVTITWKLK